MTKKIKRRNFVTEKFGLLNFLKAIDGLTSATDGKATENQPQNGAPNFNQGGGTPARNGGANSSSGAGIYPPSTPSIYPSSTPQTGGNYNYMLGVLERHEQISNRIKRR